MTESDWGAHKVPHHTPRARKALLGLGTTYLALLVYGSLVPWDYHPRPILDAWRTFQDLPYLSLGIGSRADWVANLLLFVPLGFLWQGLLWPERGTIRRLLASLVVFVSCLTLSLLIEFAQISFPPRTSSWNDIMAESIGALLGIGLWWLVGPSLR